MSKKCNKVTYLFGLAFLLLNLSNAHALWTKVNSPSGGSVSSFAAKDSILFSLVNGLVYCSNNKADSWQLTHSGISTTVNSLTKTETAMFAGTPTGVYKLADDGTRWSSVSNNLGSRRISSIGAFSNKLYAVVGSNRDTLITSSDSGASWLTVLRGHEVMCVMALNQSIFVGVKGGAYISNDTGILWTPVYIGTSTNSVYSFALYGANKVFAATWEGLFLSNDNGSHWAKAITTGLPSNIVMTSLVVSGSSIFLGTSGGYVSKPERGILRSTDGGSSWTPMSNGLSTSSIQSLAALGTTIFAGTRAGGVFKSTDNGANWTFASYGLANMDVTCFASNDSGLLAGTSGGGVYASSDSGVLWKLASNGLDTICDDFWGGAAGDGSNIYDLLSGADYVIAATYGGGVFHSPKNNISWTPIHNGLTNAYVYSLASSSKSIFAGSVNQGVFVSSNDGNSWASANKGLPGGDSVNFSVYCLAAKDSTVFASVWDKHIVYRSLNDGKNWDSANVGLKGHVSVFAVGDSDFYAGTSDSGVFRSNDNGASWVACNNGLTNSTITSFAVHGSNLFAGTQGGGVFLTTNGGTSWTAVNNGLTDAFIAALEIDKGSLFVGTRGPLPSYGAVWRRPLSEMVTSVQHGNNAISGTRLPLFRIIGTPGAQALRLAFSLKSSEHVVLKMYDVLGHVIVTFMDETKASGRYALTIPCKQIAAGVYFVKMNIGQQNTSIRVTLLKQ